MAKKRERLDVIHDILKAIQDHAGKIKTTRLLTQSNLSPQMFREYMEELLQKGFIERHETESGRFFTLTEKGFTFLEKYKGIREFIENFGL